MIIILLFAFLGGIVTILSPCILPILPIVLSGSVGGGKKKPYGIVTGFIVSFTFFTLFLTTLVRLTGISADALRSFSVLVLLIFGIVLLVPKVQLYFEKIVTKIASFAPQKQTHEGFGGGVVVGLSLGLIWTPCVGPILASVISLALTGSVNGSAVFITLAYALGTAVPMLAIMYGGRQLLHKTPWLLSRASLIQKIFGVIMIITAIGIYFNYDRQFQTYILEKFPTYGTSLTEFEDTDLIKEKLDALERERDNVADVNRKNNETDTTSSGILAPELIVGGEWINTQPLKLEDLKGKVVVLDFMTYSCINCIRTFPYLNAWYEKYTDDGLVIIGIHTPEFEFEKNPENVRKALADFDIQFPVMQDNEYATWRAYQNRYWPRKYILNYKGEIVYDHIGEGAYAETEEVIKQLLQEKNNALGMTDELDTDSVNLIPEVTSAQSPEIYFGAWRNEYLGNGDRFVIGRQQLLQPQSIQKNVLYLVGEWNITDQYAEAVSDDARVLFLYEAKNVFFVAGSDTTKTVGVNSDTKKVTDLEVREETLYEAVRGDTVQEALLELEVDSGIRMYTFTFG